MGSMLCRVHECSTVIRHFQRAVNPLKDEYRSGRTSTSKTDSRVEKVRAPLRSDRRITARMIASELNLNRTTVRQILTQELAMRRLCIQKEVRLKRRIQHTAT